MNEFPYRVLLVLFFICLVASLVIGLAEIGYSPTLLAAYDREPEPAILSSPIILAISLLSLLIADLAGLAGLFLFKPWGRTLSLVTTVAGLVLIPFLGPSPSSPIEDFFGELASLLWGAALGLAYFSPLRERFVGKPPTVLDASKAI